MPNAGSFQPLIVLEYFQNIKAALIAVMPAEAGIQIFHPTLDSRRRGNDKPRFNWGQATAITVYLRRRILMDEPETIEMPIDGTLDLHTFQPKEAPSVVDEYLHACYEKGIFEVKVIHGKGRGVLLRTVHALLEDHPLVQGFKLDSEGSGWGATIVYLRKNTEDSRQ